MPKKGGLVLFSRKGIGKDHTALLEIPTYLARRMNFGNETFPFQWPLRGSIGRAMAPPWFDWESHGPSLVRLGAVTVDQAVSTGPGNVSSVRRSDLAPTCWMHRWRDMLE
jgi:hypothetical protein